ncbi:MAG: hypothetical protein QG622_2446 [Actinomycetota bacterium]|nr:hypothetical protein [Actinomycetota bacterium]
MPRLPSACQSKHYGAVAGIADKGWDLGGYLREQREHARLSVRQLASLAGVSNPYLSQVERGLRKPSAEVLQQIARGLRISAEALYVRAGILDSEGRPDVEAAVNTDPDLNDRQRRVLLDIYASFRAENRRATEAADAADAEITPVVRDAATSPAAGAGVPDLARPSRAGVPRKRAAPGAVKRTARATTKAASKRTSRPAAAESGTKADGNGNSASSS